MDISDADAMPLPRIGSLDLSAVRADREANKFGLSGDHELATGDIPMSPRAASEQVLMTPRTALGKSQTKRAQFVSAPELHGKGPVALASNGEIHASIGVNGKLAMWDAAGSKLLCQVTLQLPADLEKKQGDKRQKELEAKPPKWVGFDCAGTCLGIHRPGIGLWLCRVRKVGEKLEVTDALMLGDGKMSEKFTWVGFSSNVAGLLAVGTDSGRVMLFSYVTAGASRSTNHLGHPSLPPSLLPPPLLPSSPGPCRAFAHPDVSVGRARASPQAQDEQAHRPKGRQASGEARVDRRGGLAQGWSVGRRLE